MLLHQFEDLSYRQGSNNIPRRLRYGAPQAMTLIVGVTRDHQSHTVVTRDGYIELVQPHHQIEFINLAELVPTGAVIPHLSDYSFCSFLVTRGIYLPFSGFQNHA